MIFENITASFLASLMAMGSFGGSIDSSFKSVIPTASAQVSQSTSTDRDWSGWRDWRGTKPVIDEIDPEAGPTGTTITLSGKRFDDENIVRFGKGAIHDTEVSEDGTTLSFTVPEEMGKYCQLWRFCTQVAYDVTPGEYAIRVQDGNKTSNRVNFEVTEDSTDPDEPLAITDIEGPDALDAGEEGTWTVHVDTQSEGNLEYSVKWGDENWMPMRLLSTEDGTIQASAIFTHVYHEDGTYVPEFKVTDEDGNEVSATTTVVVGEQEDDAVPAITELSPSRAEVGATVTITGSGFDAEGTTVTVGDVTASAVDVRGDTEITFEVPSLALARYAVIVSDNDGTSNEKDLRIVDNGRVSVAGVSAPTRLEIGQEGTWTVKADSNTSGNLMYSVDWGEEQNMMARMSSREDMTQSSATFTHAYQNEGTYTPKFTVTDEDGHTASVSATVVVVDAE